MPSTGADNARDGRCHPIKKPADYLGYDTGIYPKSGNKTPTTAPNQLPGNRSVALKNRLQYQVDCDDVARPPRLPDRVLVAEQTSIEAEPAQADNSYPVENTS